MRPVIMFAIGAIASLCILGYAVHIGLQTDRGHQHRRRRPDRRIRHRLDDLGRAEATL